MTATTVTPLAVRVDEIAAACPLTADWRAADSDPTLCRWCCGWLGSRHPATQRFCSTACRTSFWANHSWKSAKEAVKKRAGRRCEGVLADGSRCDSKGRATFQVHHLSGAKEGGRTRLAACDHHLTGLAYLCPGCHHREHHGAEGGDQ